MWEAFERPGAQPRRRRSQPAKETSKTRAWEKALIARELVILLRHKEETRRTSSGLGKGQPRQGMNEEEFQDLLYRASGGETAFVLAAVDQDLALLNRADQDGVRLLHYACDGGELELVQGLVERGSDLHAKDDAGEDALYLAVNNKKLTVATYLLDRGADPCTRTDDWTVLGWAAFRGYHEMCLLLVSHGADLEVKMIGDEAEGAEESTALELYCKYFGLTPQQLEQRRQALREAFAKRNMEQELKRLGKRVA